MAEYDDVITQLYPSAPKKPLNPGSEALMRTSSPDEAAQAQQLAVDTGLPEQVVQRNLPAVQQRVEANRYTQFLDSNPEVATLGDSFHVVAKDDVDTLDHLRIAGKNLGAGLIRIAGGVAGIMQAVEEGLNLPNVAADKLFGTDISENNALTETADFFADLHKKASAQADKLTAENERVGVFEQGVYGGVQSLATNLPILASAFLAKNPQLAMAGMTGLVFGDEYVTARESGLTVGQSTLYGGTQAGIEYFTEKLPVGMLFGDIAAKSGLLTTLAKQMATEIPGEQVATILQDFNEFVTLHPEKTIEQYLAERPDAAYQTLIATVVASGTQGAILHQLGTRMSGDAMQATEREKFLKELSSLAEASKLRERSPEQFQRYMETVAPDTDIYFDSADAEKLMQSDIDLSEDIEARIAEAAEHDQPVRITAAEYATYFADSHTAQQLASRARVGSAVAMNAEEAKNIESEFAARADQVMAESDNEAAARVDASKISDSVRTQIMATGRFRHDVASAYASLVENFFVTMASRSGMSAGELFAQYPLRVQAAGTDTTNKLEQLPASAFVTETRGPGAFEIIVRNPANGKRAGYMEFEESSERVQIKLVGLNDLSLRGQGVGQQLVMQAYEKAQELGKPLVSDRAVSAHQLRVYEALRRKGWTIEYADPDQVRRVLEIASQSEANGGKLDEIGNALGASAPLGGAVVTKIAPPQEQLQQSALPDTSVVPAAEAQGNLYDASRDEQGLRQKAQFATRFTMDDSGARVPLDTKFDPGEFALLVKGAGFAGYTGGELLAGQAKLVGVTPTKLPVRTRMTVPLGSVLASRIALEGAAEDTRNDRGTRTTGPLHVRQLEDGQLLLVDGYHRFSDAILRGDETVDVEVVGYARSEDMAPRAGDEYRTERHALFQLAPEHEPVGFDAVAPYLTEAERAKLMKSTAAKLVNLFESLPSDADFVDAAKAGEAKRGWYENTVTTLRQVFGDEDAPRFAGLLAAMSPQIGVQGNLQNAAAVWAAWDAAGRPTDATAINNIMSEALGGADSVLKAWRNNSVRALSAEDPHAVQLSGPKVNSFMRNLMGDVQEVTNDTWMANFALVSQTIFNNGGVKPNKPAGKTVGYLAYNAKIRKAAQTLGWTPAEVQETIWSWAKTAYELADVAGETRSIEDLVRAGEITDARVAGATDFASLLKNNAPIRNILEAAGYGEAINAIEVEFGGKESASGAARQAVTPAILRSARRLDEVRRQRDGTERGSAEPEAVQNTTAGAALVGLPKSSTGPIPAIQAAAKRYVDDVLVNKPEVPPHTKYVAVNTERATRIAQAYEDAKHQPEDFETAVAYDAMIDETLAQYQIVKELGIEIEFIKPGQENPYADGPRMVHEDLRNGHLWVFPTDLGFGTEEAPGNPLLRPTSEVIGDRLLLANDVFRIVHDVFGHGKDGVGFGPTGEENAWQSHVRMYSPLAARAMTSETRGQNSWVNYGPHGEANRTNQKETVYAAQKATLLPSWTMEGLEEAHEAPAPLQQQARGEIAMGRDLHLTPSVVTLFEGADLSTFLHESGHFFFEVMADLATRPNAAPAITKDMETLLKWVGYSDSVSAWRALPLSQRVEGHEKFARGFEAWLMEGNAPSEEVRGLFHRFRAWLVNVYKSVERLNVELTDEVRTIMSAMVATQEQVKQAEAARAYLPLFLSQDVSGMTPEEWEAYQDTTRAATETAQDALQARSMKNLRWLDNARTRELKKLQAANADKRNAVREEVTAELDGEPARVAETLILTGLAYTEDLVDGSLEEINIPNHKLSVAALEEAYGTREEYIQMLKDSGVDDPTARAPWESLPRTMLTKGEGMSADEIAELTGFSSGDELIHALLNLPSRDVVIQQQTDRRMMERYGDLNNPQTLARAVDMAVHNQHRTRVVASELRALDDALKTTPGGIETVKRAAREYASTVVQRQKIRELRPAQYLAAETRAARDSRVLLENGNLKAAAVRKRDQLFNGYASRDASRALDMVDKGLRYLKKFADSKVRASLDPSYRDQIDKLLERYDLRRRPLADVDKRATLAAWIKEQEANGSDPLIPEDLVDESRRVNYQNLSVEAFDGLVDAIKNIEHLARLKKRLLAAKEQRDFDTAVTEIVDSIELHAPKGESKQQLEKDLSLWGKFSDTLNSWFTHLRKMSSVSRQIDGGLDGGKFWSYMMQPVNAAADKEVAMRAAATKKLNTLLDSLPALRTSFVERLGRKVKGPPKMYIAAIDESLTLEARLAVALNWGNEGNRERIMEGNKWTQLQAEAVLETLTKDEMDFVQATLDYIGSFWSEIAAKEERVTGVRPKRVDAAPINTKHGTYAGGYYPIVADPGRSEKAAVQNDAELISQSLRGAVTRATTRRGHTKERVGGKDPVRLDLGVITQHVGQVIHDLSWHEALIDAGRLLRDKRISGVLRDKYGAEVTRLFRKTLDDVARGEVTASDAGERIVNHFRVGATIAGLGLSVTTALLQPTGVTQSFIRVGYRHMAYGLMEFAARPVQSIAKVRAASTFMRDRGLVLNRELGEITNRLGGGSALTNFYFLPIQALQTAVDVPTWLGAYNKAFEAGETDERAIALADQAVRDAQSSGQLQDLAEVQRGGAYKKLFTNFYSYFSATYQLSAESIQGFKRDPSLMSGIKLGSDFLMLYTVPAMLGLLIREGLRGDLDDEEPEALAEAIIKAQLSAMLGVFPYVRELGGAIAGFEYRGPAGLGFLAHTTSVIKQLEQGEIDEPLLRAANRAAGNAFHYPANQVDRTVRGLIAVAEGEAGPQAILVGPPKKE